MYVRMGGWMCRFGKLGGQGMGTLGLCKLVGLCRGLSSWWFGFGTLRGPPQEHEIDIL